MVQMSIAYYPQTIATTGSIPVCYSISIFLNISITTTTNIWVSNIHLPGWFINLLLFSAIMSVLDPVLSKPVVPEKILWEMYPAIVPTSSRWKSAGNCRRQCQHSFYPDNFYMKLITLRSLVPCPTDAGQAGSLLTPAIKIKSPCKSNIYRAVFISSKRSSTNIFFRI